MKDDTKSKKDKKKNDAVVKNTIELNPKLEEAVSSTAVFSFGRMNPPTIGHEKVVAKINAIAAQNDAMPHLYLSQTYDSKKNPLPYVTKIAIAKKAFGSMVTKSRSKTIMQVAKELEDMGHTKLIMVAGSDRVAEFETLLNKYNGKEYTFDSIEVVSAGERDPDAEGAEGMSASKMRAAAADGDERAFKTGLPKKLQSSSSKIFQAIRDGMKIAEEMELELGEDLMFEAVLSVAARKKRAMAFKKAKSKIMRGRRIAAKKMASPEKLKIRARKKAIQIIRKKVAGKKGVNYDQLSPSERMSVDKQVEKKKAAIGKIAKKLLPLVKKAEKERLAKVREGPAEESVDAVTKTSKHTKRYHKMFGKEGVVKHDQRFKRYRVNRAAPVELDEKGLIEEVDYMLDDVLNEMFEEVLVEKSLAGLEKKAEKSGISYGILKKVYDRGMAAWRTGHRPGALQEQWAYARVNSFITKGKGTWGKADADLAAKVRNEEFDLDEGVYDPAIFKAVFLAGGPGSGKSFVVGKTALTALGLKLVNSDDAFEALLKKVGLKATPEDIFSPKGQKVRSRAVALTGLKQKLALNGRLGLIIDGTGKNYSKIKQQADELELLGYDTAMIFVNSDLKTAQARNKARERTLPEDEVEKMWNAVQRNIGSFQTQFGRNFIVIDTSEEVNAKAAKVRFDAAAMAIYKRMAVWVKKEPKRPAAKKWIRDAKAAKVRNEEVEHEGVIESFNAMINDTMFTIEFSEQQAEDGFVPSVVESLDVDESKLGIMLNKGKYKKAVELVKKERDKDRSRSVGYWAAEVIRKHSLNLNPRALAKMVEEEYGAGEQGTDELNAKYKKDTPGQ